MCIQGADASVWKRPETTLILKATPSVPRGSRRSLAMRAALAVPFALVALSLFTVGGIFLWAANRILGRRSTLTLRRSP